MTIYTSGDWHAKPGGEDGFPKAWCDLSTTAIAQVDPHAWAILLQDRENPRHFVSIGGWSDEEAVIEWRDGTGLTQFLGKLDELLEEASSSTFVLVESAGRSDLIP